jgi:copper chaperone CopZ
MYNYSTIHFFTEDSLEQLTLHIEGMSCGHCLNAVTKALTALDGVAIESVKIGRAELRFDPNRNDATRIAAAVSAEGYRATSAPTAG